MLATGQKNPSLVKRVNTAMGQEAPIASPVLEQTTILPKLPLTVQPLVMDITQNLWGRTTFEQDEGYALRDSSAREALNMSVCLVSTHREVQLVAFLAMWAEVLFTDPNRCPRSARKPHLDTSDCFLLGQSRVKGATIV